MADPVKGKLQVLDSQGHPVFTIDPDSGFEQIVYTTTTGQRLMDMSNGTAGTVGVGFPYFPHRGRAFEEARVMASAAVGGVCARTLKSTPKPLYGAAWCSR